MRALLDNLGATGLMDLNNRDLNAVSSGADSYRKYFAERREYLIAIVERLHQMRDEQRKLLEGR